MKTKLRKEKRFNRERAKSTTRGVKRNPLQEGECGRKKREDAARLLTGGEWKAGENWKPKEKEEDRRNGDLTSRRKMAQPVPRGGRKPLPEMVKRFRQQGLVFREKDQGNYLRQTTT